MTTVSRWSSPASAASAIKKIFRIAYILALLVGAGICAIFIRDGFDTDLYSLTKSYRRDNSQQELFGALARNFSSRVRVLCADEACAEKCRAVFKFEEPVDPKGFMELIRTHGAGLLSEKHRELLKAGETNKIVRSALRRDYSGVGLFPKEDDPYYFLNDFVMDLKRFVPKDPPEGMVLLQGDTSDNEPGAVAALIELAQENDSAIAVSGPAFHSYLATESSKNEIGLLSLISIAAVIILGFLLFRNLVFTLPLVLALGSGFLVGMTALLLLPGKPHILTMVFGTSLIGLGVDYCYHGLSRHSDCFVRNLTSALVTTCLAFFPLLFSRVAVLNQMALFTIVGLVAIYLFVLLFCRGAEKDPVTKPSKPGILGSWWIKLIMLIIVGAGLFRIHFGNDLSKFHEMDPLLKRCEAQVAEAVGVGPMKFKLLNFESWQKENAALKEMNGFEVKGDLLSAAHLPRWMTVHHKSWHVVPIPSDADDAVDVKRVLLDLFDEFAAESGVLLVVSLAVLLLVLVRIYRLRSLRYLLPVSAAVIATAGFLGWMGDPVNFFQILCFFAITGLGIDYAIFHLDGEQSTGRVVRFSFLTSLVGFGMLSFTDFQVTRSMGVTLAAGLFFSYLFSLPSLKSAKAESGSWNEREEQSAGKFRILLMVAICRVFGKNIAKIITFFIISFIYPFAKSARAAVRSNLSRLGTGPKKRPIFKVFLNFAWSMIDKTAACGGFGKAPEFVFTGDETWRKGGCFLMSTHVGCVEVLPSVGIDFPRAHAFQQLKHNAIFTEIFLKNLDKSLLTLHAVEEIGVETAVEMQEAIKRGEIVLMAGDRPSANRSGIGHCEFFGDKVEYPKGVFKFAKLMESPVYAITCVRTGWNRYEVEAVKLTKNMLSDYMEFLEKQVRKFADQWYQFHPVFDIITDDSERNKDED